MAEFATDIYRTQPPKQVEPFSPMQVLQMLGQANTLQQQKMDIEGKQGIIDASKGAVTPGGAIDFEKYARDVVQKGGIHAPGTVGQVISGQTAQTGLERGNVKYAQDTLAALASKKDLRPSDLLNWAIIAKTAKVPQSTIDAILDGAYSSGKDLKKFLTTQGIMSLGTGALEAAPGQFDPETGRTPEVPKGEAIENRVFGTQNQPAQPRGAFTTAPARYEENLAQMNAERKIASDFKSNAYPIEEALRVYSTAEPGMTGPLTSELNTIKTFAKSFFPDAPWVENIDREKISDYEKLNKYLTQLAQSQGTRSDLALGTAFSANPNTKLSTLGGQALSTGILSLARYNIASILDADNQNVTPDKYPKWKSKEWSNNYDPRAFGIDKMSLEQIEKLQKSMKPDEKKKFNATVKKGIELGLLPDPRQQ